MLSENGNPARTSPAWVAWREVWTVGGEIIVMGRAEFMRLVTGERSCREPVPARSP